MNVLLALSVFVAAALAKEECCLPYEFEIAEGIIGSREREGGKFESYVERRRRLYDFPMRRSGWEAVMDFMNGTKQEFKLIEHYEQRAYWFIEEKNEKCTKHASRSREPERCVTYNDKFIREFYVGDRAIYVDEWGKSIDHEGEKGFETRSFVRGSCIPFSVVFMGKEIREEKNATITRTALYEDFVKGDYDFKKFFTLPDFCPQ